MLCNGRTGSVERDCRWNTRIVDVSDRACLVGRRGWSVRKTERVTDIAIEKENC